MNTVKRFYSCGSWNCTKTKMLICSYTFKYKDLAVFGNMFALFFLLFSSRWCSNLLHCQAFLLSAEQKLSFFSWEDWCLLCDQVALIPVLPFHVVECDREWSSELLKSPRSFSSGPAARRSVVPPEVSQGPLLRSASMSGDGLGWERVLICLCLCFSLRNGDS